MKVKDSYGFYTDQLNPAYRAAFDQVETYVTASMVDTDTATACCSALWWAQSNAASAAG